jgi:MtN3 and saliva related transmembrane protein
MGDILGWISSSILVITLFVQVRKQWHDDTSKGVSPWLFIGQLSASLGFLLYSIAIENWVFIVTNTLTGIAALLGLWIVRRHARRRNSGVKFAEDRTNVRRNHVGDRTSQETTP